MDGFIDLLEELKYDEQDEKTIIDFKEKINTPIEYSTHLKRYEFSEEWFSTLDDILIELGYRALDTDIKYIQTELKQLIYNTHINLIIDTYNKYSEIKLKKLLKYDIKFSDQSYNLIEIVDYLIENPKKINAEFSHNTHNKAVKYLIEHENKIDFWGFQYNKNSLAVEYNVKNPDEINWNLFSFNNSDIAVRYMIEHPDKIEWDIFSRNTADDAVNYLIKHPDKIDWSGFSQNTSDIAVRYCIEHPDKIGIWENTFSKNTNDIAVKWLIDHSINIIWYHFSRNTSNIAVQYLIEHLDKIDWRGFSQNTSDDAVRYCIEHFDKVDLNEFHTNTNCIAIEYIKYIYPPQRYGLYRFNSSVLNFICFNISKIGRCVENIFNKAKNYLLYIFGLKPKFTYQKKSVEYFLENQNCINWTYMNYNLPYWKINTIYVLNWLSKSRLSL